MPPNGSLQETAARGVEAISTLVGERDQLLAQSDRMKTDIALLRERSDQLESRLNVAIAERDHYMRYCTEMVTQINTITTVIATAKEHANRAAYKPPLVPVPKTAVLEIDTKGIENLISRLPQNSGNGNGTK